MDFKEAIKLVVRKGKENSNLVGGHTVTNMNAGLKTKYARMSPKKGQSKVNGV